MNCNDLLRPVEDIAREVGGYLKNLQPRVRQEQKAGKDFLTDADLMSHRLIKIRLEKLTPKIRIYSEEDEAEIAETGETCWIVDPLDGSINYFHQDSCWGVSIALVENKQTQMGVVYLPALRRGIAITAGKSFVRPDSLGVRKDTDISRAQIWTDHTKGSPELVIGIFSKLSKVSLYPQVRLCATYSLLSVAFGKIAGYVHSAPKPEDFSAACLAVEKAGGKVTDLEGNPWSPFSKSIVASNGLLHEKILDAVNS